MRWLLGVYASATCIKWRESRPTVQKLKLVNWINGCEVMDMQSFACFHIKFLLPTSNAHAYSWKFWHPWSGMNLTYWNTTYSVNLVLSSPASCTLCQPISCRRINHLKTPLSATPLLNPAIPPPLPFFWVWQQLLEGKIFQKKKKKKKKKNPKKSPPKQI